MIIKSLAYQRYIKEQPQTFWKMTNRRLSQLDSFRPPFVLFQFGCIDYKFSFSRTLDRCFAPHLPVNVFLWMHCTCTAHTGSAKGEYEAMRRWSQSSLWSGGAEMRWPLVDGGRIILHVFPFCFPFHHPSTCCIHWFNQIQRVRERERERWRPFNNNNNSAATRQLTRGGWQGVGQNSSSGGGKERDGRNRGGVVEEEEEDQQQQGWLWWWVELRDCSL